MSADISNLLNLITSAHQDKPKFVAAVSTIVQGLADERSVLRSIPSLYDLDSAQGEQLDIVGKWIGRTRQLLTPIEGVYFSWDTVGLGWDEATWRGPFDPTEGLVSLPDDTYRVYLKAVVAANKWDGTIPGAYAAWNVLFAAIGGVIKIRDNQNMTMDLAYFASSPPTAVVRALIVGGYIGLKPAGVEISNYYYNDWSTPL